MELLAVALRLRARRGYAAVGLRDVAAEAGVTTGSIYHHFPSKEALVRAAVDHHMDLVLAEQDELSAAGGTAAERLLRLVDWLVSAERPDSGWRRDFSVVVNVELRKAPGFERVYGRLRKRFTRLVAEPLADGVASGELVLPEGTTVDDVATAFMAGVVGLLQMHALRSLGVPLDRALRLHTALVLDGLRAQSS